MQKRFQEVTAPSRVNSIFIHFTCAIDTAGVGKIIKELRREVLISTNEQCVL